ncbi:MAG: hypothetical protein KDD67_08020 [Ignavibacteriae bacterium]|nr:hypothetical protein [Ignavibacteriota bacterium]MCB9215942.1 hypothetical protein [Ignavibacteria bacterium]
MIRRQWVAGNRNIRFYESCLILLSAISHPCPSPKVWSGIPRVFVVGEGSRSSESHYTRLEVGCE